jgi:hypothetical protein
MMPTTAPSTTPTITLTYTPTPTLSPFALATIWSEDYPVPTPPYGFPTPFPPELSYYFDDTYKYGGTTIISENNLITLWSSNNGRDGQAITITGKKGNGLFVQARYLLQIEKIFSGNPNAQDFQYPTSAKELFDINNDGVDEIVISRHDGGNVCLQGLYIYKLGNPATLIAKEIYCGDFWFEDLNKDGSLELLTHELFLSYFPLDPKIGEFIRVTQIFEYNPAQGYISSSCKFKDYYTWIKDPKDVILPQKPDNPNDVFDYDSKISSTALDYLMIGNITTAKNIISKGLDGEKQTVALEAIDILHKEIQSSICP